MIAIFLLFLLFSYLLYNMATIEGLRTFNGRMAVDDQYYHDRLLNDVTYYPNEYDKDYKTGEEIGLLVNRGLDKCNNKCPGNCVEYGITGHSYCFPY